MLRNTKEIRTVRIQALPSTRRHVFASLALWTLCIFGIGTIQEAKADCVPSETCNGHGSCNDEGTCLCDAGWALPNCGQCQTDYYPENLCNEYCSPDLTCHGNGFCGDEGTCLCDAGWALPDCGECQDNYYPNDRCDTYCHAEVTCHGNGSCSRNGACLCEWGYDTPGFYDVEECVECWVVFSGDSCQSCAEGFLGHHPDCKAPNRITALVPAEHWNFGSSVAVSGERLLVGSESHGGFIVERRAEGSWEVVAQLTMDYTERPAWFGQSVAIDGDWAVVGGIETRALGEDDPGAAVVFERRAPDGSWVRGARLDGADYGATNMFGDSVAIWGDQVFVADRWADDKAGTVYVFQIAQDGTATALDNLTALDPKSGDGLGTSLFAGNGRIVVGASGDPHGDEGSGSAYVFEWDSAAGSWSQVAKLEADDAASVKSFGLSVGANGDRVAVGCSRKAYIFERSSDAAWNQVFQVTQGEYPGRSLAHTVAISGERMVVGASTRLGDFDGLDDFGAYVAAYVIERDSVTGSWSLSEELSFPDRTQPDSFGSAVAISDTFAFVAAPDHLHYGVDGWPGSVFFFDFAPGCDGASDCDQNRVCSPYGVCVCMEGWVGSDCQECDAGYYPEGVCNTYCVASEHCDDGDLCNGEERCDPESGLCALGIALDCDDLDLCTADSCDPVIGCIHSAVDGCCSSNEDCAAQNLLCDPSLSSCVEVACRSCEIDEDCGAAENRCVAFASGNACIVDCSDDENVCGDGASCVAREDGDILCIPLAGDCDCVETQDVSCLAGEMQRLDSCGQPLEVVDDCNGRGCTSEGCCEAGSHEMDGTCVTDGTPDAGFVDVGADVGEPAVDIAQQPGPDVTASGPGSGCGIAPNSSAAPVLFILLVMLIAVLRQSAPFGRSR